MSLRAKLLLLSAIIAILPVTVVLLILQKSVDQKQKFVEKEFMTLLEMEAHSIIDRFDRTIFERYGDAQAFGYNAAAHVDLEQITAAQRDLLIGTINRYVTGYGCYSLSVVVTPSGKIAAINTVNASGNEISSSAEIGQDLSSQPWFAKVKNGEFSTGPGLLSGTVMTPPERDALVMKLYGDKSPSWNMVFAAPINDAKGSLIGYWANYFDSGMLEQIVISEQKDMVKLGMTNVEITIIDAKGRLVIDCDPAFTNKEINRDQLFKLNLKDSGVQLAVTALTGDPLGYGRSVHARKQVEQFGGYARSVPILNFTGSGMVALVRDDGLSMPNNQQLLFIAVLAAGITITVALLASWLFANRISRPIIYVAKELDIGAQQVTSAASEVSTGSQRIAQGASEQAASLEQTTASLEELSATCTQNANNARQANALAGEAASASETGEGAARQAATAVATQMSELAKAIDAIRASTEKTTQVVESIDDIAIQINLLALNAAVEAARAGEAGLGFAVVADEVRNLAARSTEEAKNTSALIREARANTERVHEVSRQVQEYLTKTLNQDVVGSFQKLVTMVRKVAQLSAEVAAASDEQSRGVGQINSAVAEMDKVTQENAASAEQSAASSEEMQAQAVSLREGVRRLRTVIGAAVDSADQPTGPARAQEPQVAPKPAPARNGHAFHAVNGHASSSPGERSPSTNGKSAAQVMPLTDEESREHQGDFSRF